MLGVNKRDGKKREMQEDEGILFLELFCGAKFWRGAHAHGIAVGACRARSRLSRRGVDFVSLLGGGRDEVGRSGIELNRADGGRVAEWRAGFERCEG